MGRSTVHYADNQTNTILKKLHNKLRPAGTPVQRVEYIIELLLLRIFEVRLKQDPDFVTLRKLFDAPNDHLLFSSLYSVANERLLAALNEQFFPFYSNILGHARKVYTGNLSQKVQDQLVLIEEVFANSNFTNNVKSGNLQEIISLITDIDEERLLKTDLLGDAIESALSETGGTKDIGLHRTPDHIRQFMVGLVQPTFNDSSFDPACGTAGFLFDNFGYVMESVSRDGHWPGPKAHPELQAYFQVHFSSMTGGMPSQEKAITFYRSGLFGIEYLGMIRKMAAINLYIRGLNPQNIEQGDSLAMFDPIKDRNSKTIVLANPPFGAQRDQEAYPNIWEEFPRESETTILFVKLMLDALEPGGRCAVIVSEGFMTWDQGSARALRKMLLETANLKAIISLPQGVFVSKGGVGPKTSILLFEKGPPTKEVWFYKVTNDGYTMGTNRKPIEGCQLVEALRLYDEYVRHGKTPPETKHSFSIPSEWIERLDPRIKQRIKEETTAEMTEKAAVDKDKLAKKLQKQLDNGDIDKADYNGKLREHEELWRSKTQNEIAKRIEREHLYSFNLPNLRSNLSHTQIEAWTAFAAERETVTADTLEQHYEQLLTAKPEEMDRLLSAFDPRNTLELDIARHQAIVAGANTILDNWKIDLGDAVTYPKVELESLIDESLYGTSEKADYKEEGYKVLRIGNITFCDFDLKDIKRVPLSDKEAKRYLLRENDFLIVRSNGNPALVGKCAVWTGGDDFIYASYLIRFRFNKNQVNPRYVMYYLMSEKGRSLLSPQQGGGTYNISASVFQKVKIALPPIELQNQLVSTLDTALRTLKDITELAEMNSQSIASKLNDIWEN